MSQLNKDDALAVDVFLESRAGASDDSDGQPALAEPQLRRRLEAADRLFSMIAIMPALEPPADLVERTMSRIDAAITAMALQVAESEDAPLAQPEA